MITPKFVLRFFGKNKNCMATSKIYKIHSCVATSLEQLLIAVLISSIIILTLFQFYNVVKKQLHKIEQQTTMLYHQYVADFFLRNNIRQAGYKGFVSSMLFPQYSSVVTADGRNIIPESSIAVCKARVASCQPFVTNKLLRKINNHKIKPNTNILLVYDIAEQITFLIEDMLDYSSPLKIDMAEKFFMVGEQMIISDLQCMQRFVLSNIIGKQLIHEQPYNTTNNFIKNFQRGSQIFRVKHLAFYIAKNDSHTSEVYSLYMDDLSLNNKHHAEALLDNVDNLLVQVVEQVLDGDNVVKLVDATEIGWVSNKYILITLLFKHNKAKMPTMQIGVEVRNNG